jgi:uncharacterized membrane protein
MATTAYLDPGSVFGTSVPKVWKPRLGRTLYGDVAIVAFLIAQCLDGIFTYVGVNIYGLGVEANPLIASLMASVGHGTALFGAKCVAGALGMCLHLREIHSAVAALAGFYVAVAIVPWVTILLM